MSAPRFEWRLVITLVAPAVLLGNVAARIGGTSADQLFLYWRSTDDLAIAAGLAAKGEFPVAPFRVKDTVRREKDPRFVVFRDNLFQEISDRRARPLAFWRTVPLRTISPDRQWRAAERFDDGGRALLLGICYRVLDGVAPFLLFWLGALVAVPLLAALVLEFRSAGETRVGLVFSVLLSSSAFFVDMLTIGYSAVAFHVLGLITLAAIAVHCTLGTVTARGLIVRALIAGCLLGVFSIARGTVLSLFPAFALALGLGLLRLGRRPEASRNRIRLLVQFGFALGLLCLPYVLLSDVVDRMTQKTMADRGRPNLPRYHDPALLIWKGLGDFDRTKGYEFRDKAGERAIIRSSETGNAARAQEIHLRSVILSDIKEDPLWFASILTKRTLATIFLRKIWPYGPRTGTSIVPAASPNEGVIDSYYGLSAQADWIALGRWNREVPVAFLLLPTLILILICIAPPFWRSTLRSGLRKSVPALSLLSAGVLATPVLITTATAFEPQCFVFVHLLAASFLIDRIGAQVLGR